MSHGHSWSPTLLDTCARLLSAPDLKKIPREDGRYNRQRVILAATVDPGDDPWHQMTERATSLGTVFEGTEPV
jgi:hypothetical protein